MQTVTKCSTKTKRRTFFVFAVSRPGSISHRRSKLPSKGLPVLPGLFIAKIFFFFDLFTSFLICKMQESGNILTVYFFVQKKLREKKKKKKKDKRTLVCLLSFSVFCVYMHLFVVVPFMFWSYSLFADIIIIVICCLLCSCVVFPLLVLLTRVCRLVSKLMD